MSSADLAQWAADSTRQHDPATISAAIAGIRDATGCMLAGAGQPEPRGVAAAIASWGAGRCMIVGTPHQAPAPWAALVNGTAAHVLDFDDTFDPLSGHAAAVLVPAIFAEAQERDAAGIDVVDAFIVGLEVLSRIGRVVNPRHYALGWHATSTLGVIGAAAACARLRRLDANGMTAAFSLAVSMAGGTRMQLGAPAKSLHAGLAAKNGVIAASLAAAGMSGVTESLAGRWRFAEMYTGENAEPAAFTAPQPGDIPAIIDPGLNFKPYPTCAATHRTLDAVLELRAAHRLEADAVRQVVTRVPAVHARNLMYPAPETGMQARFSMPYSVAAALASGAVRTADFEGAAIFRPQLRALMQRIDMVEIPNSLGAIPEPDTQVSITLQDGRVLHQTQQRRRGTAERPMTPDEHAKKFRDCAIVALSRDGVDLALSAFAELPGAANLAALRAALSTKTPALA